MLQNIQDLEKQRQVVTNTFTRNKKSRLSALFRRLRRSPELSFIGVYPILIMIVSVARLLGINPSRQEINYALNQSKELKDRGDIKRTLLDRLGIV